MDKLNKCMYFPREIDGNRSYVADIPCPPSSFYDSFSGLCIEKSQKNTFYYLPYCPPTRYCKNKNLVTKSISTPYPTSSPYQYYQCIAFHK